jgi:uncharacterized membrane protein YvbJ
MIMNQELKNKLANGVVRISFNKKDGTLRTMEATTYGPIIPAEYQPKHEDERSYSDEVQRVFDTEINEWRSFRWDSLVSYTDVNAT